MLVGVFHNLPKPVYNLNDSESFNEILHCHENIVYLLFQIYKRKTTIYLVEWFIHVSEYTCALLFLKLLYNLIQFFNHFSIHFILQLCLVYERSYSGKDHSALFLFRIVLKLFFPVPWLNGKIIV